MMIIITIVLSSLLLSLRSPTQQSPTANRVRRIFLQMFQILCKIRFLVDAPLLYVQIEYAPTKGKFFFWDFFSQLCEVSITQALVEQFPIYGYGYTDIWMDIWIYGYMDGYIYGYIWNV